jgi:hypothetical protein
VLSPARLGELEALRPSDDSRRYRRFWIAYGAWLVVFAALNGAVVTIQVATSLEPFGGLDYASRVVGLSVTRVLAAGAVFVASMFSWITLEHGARVTDVHARFRGTALRLLIAGPIAYPVAVSTASLASFLVMTQAYSVSSALFVSGCRDTLRVSDAAAGELATAAGLAALVIVSRFAMPRVAAVDWSLPSKLLAAFLALAFVRGAAAVLEELVTTSLS